MLSKKIAITAIAGAVLVAAKFALSFIPNVEIVTPLIITFSAVFGIGITLAATVVFCLLDIFIYGFFPLVSIQYFFHFPLLAVVSCLVAKRTKNSEVALGVVAVCFALLFWVETPIINEIFSFSPFLPTLVSGIPFMIPMLISNFIVIMVFCKPLIKVLAPFAIDNKNGFRDET